jgi:hypothetical protein
MTLLLSFAGLPKIYVYWKDTNYVIEIDPQTAISEKYNRHHAISLVYDLTLETYAEIVEKSILVMHKKSGKEIAKLMSQGENFTQLFFDGSKDKVYSLSDRGLKRWKL